MKVNGRLNLKYFLILFLIISILFILSYYYTYNNHLSAFNEENRKTIELIGNSLDDELTRANYAAVQLSLLPAMKNAITKKDITLMTEYKKIFDYMYSNIRDNKTLNSIYVYFIDIKKVLTNNTFYDTDNFYEPELLPRLSDVNSVDMWFDYRRVKSEYYSYIYPTDVVSVIKKLPDMAHSPSALIVINLDQRKLLGSVSNYKLAKGVSIIYDNKIAASMKEGTIGQAFDSLYQNVSFDGDTGFVSLDGLYLYYRKSGISELIYFNTVNKIEFTKLFTPYRYIFVLMYLTSIMALIFFSYLLSKITKRRIGYFIHKLSGQLHKYSGEENEANEFAALDRAIDNIVIRNKLIEDKIENYNHIVKNMLIMEILTGITMSDKDLEQQLVYSDISFNHTSYIAAIGVIIDSERDEGFKNEKSAYNKNLLIKEIVEKRLSGKFKIFSALIDNEKIGFIVNHDLAEKDVLEELSISLQEINTSIQRDLNVYLLFSIGNNVSSIIEVSKSYRNASKNLNFKGVCDSNLILKDMSEAKDTPAFPVSIQNRIVSGFKNNSRELIIESINSFFNEYMRNNSYSLEGVKNIAIILFCSTINVLWQNDFNVSMDEGSEIINSISEKNSAKELNQCLNELFIGILQKQDTYTMTNNPNNTEYISKVVNFINENYATDLSISDIAACVNLNPRYLGVLFKDATGHTLIEYLNIVRIKKAKQLLAKGDKAIKDISMDVGYNDVHAFIRHFKKMNNITPSEYREQC